MLHHGCIPLLMTQKSMTDRNQYLLELAKRNVKAYIVNPKTKAAMVTGSVAEGLCDEYSDCDIILFHEIPDTDKASRIKSHPVTEATTESVSLSKI